ncbi:hypothetical protein DXT99_19970 [Pontibacter diazotrophicus]|uniref:Uncharacterized protein n=1 Tax=Pontibacter diazotrophicus TaxID=1400979 RepID=A0A3D8L7C0_9BACT|nr:hypothetical protein [Pontibacter diazotrophicus]RDV13301.1 hypothetical protein DXT99_19970 [Pontibacter diazotrophicus]
MKTKLFLSCLMMIVAFTEGNSQTLNGRLLEVPTLDSKGLTGDVLKVDMYDKDCIHVVDGMIASYNDVVSNQQLAHFERAASREKLAELGFSDGQCVIVKSTADLDIENYVYRQVHEHVRQIGIQYKLPIAVNGKLILSYSARQRQLSHIKAEQVKSVKFLSKAEARAKYGDKVIFGLIEITV